MHTFQSFDIKIILYACVNISRIDLDQLNRRDMPSSSRVIKCWKDQQELDDRGLIVSVDITLKSMFRAVKNDKI